MLVAQLLTVWAPLSSGTDWSAPLVKVGASLTAVTLIRKVCAALVSLPPLAVPPLSFRTIVIVELPLAFGAGVNVRVPLAEIAGCVENRALLLLLVTLKVRV